MGKLSFEPPTADNRTIWPIVLTVLHFTCFICGFFVAIPISLSHFHDQCPLYANIDGQAFHPGAKSNCDYVMGIGIFCIIYSAGIVAIQVLLFLRCGKNISCLTKLFGPMNIIFCVVNIIVSFLLLVAGCIVSVGFTTWCSNFKEAIEKYAEPTDYDVDYSVYSCRLYHEVLEKHPFTRGLDFDVFGHLFTVQIGIWLCLMVWLVITLLGLFNLWRIGGIPFAPK